MSEIPEELAGRIVSFCAVLRNRYDVRRNEPEWADRVTRFSDRYGALIRTMNFMDASDTAMTEEIARMIDAAIRSHPQQGDVK